MCAVSVVSNLCAAQNHSLLLTGINPNQMPASGDGILGRYLCVAVLLLLGGLLYQIIQWLHVACTYVVLSPVVTGTVCTGQRRTPGLCISPPMPVLQNVGTLRSILDVVLHMATGCGCIISTHCTACSSVCSSFSADNQFQYFVARQLYVQLITACLALFQEQQ